MTGRWPANVILSPEMAEALDTQSGVLKSGGGDRRSAKGREGTDWRMSHGDKPRIVEASEGGASRFFLTAGYEPWELEWIIVNGLTPCGT